MAMDTNTLGSDIASAIDALVAGNTDEGFTPPTSKDIWTAFSEKVITHILDNIEVNFEQDGDVVSTVVVASPPLVGLPGVGAGSLGDKTGKQTGVK